MTQLLSEDDSIRKPTLGKDRLMHRDNHFFVLIILLLATLTIVTSSLFSQTSIKRQIPKQKDTSKSAHQQVASKTSLIKKYYYLAIAYKNGDSVAMDYHKAFAYFSKAADLGDPQSLYAKGYCFYKSIGCTQSYDSAAKYFRQGAYSGRDNSMYMLALCYRNQYVDVPEALDSAKYWLQKAAALGYRQAIMELNTKTPEHTDNKDAQALVSQIHNAALPAKTPLNQFIPIKPAPPDSSVIYGSFTGYLIGYDWSGKYIINTKKLTLQLTKDTTAGGSHQITGQWVEQDVPAVIIHAIIKQDSLTFSKMHYRRVDHYSSGDGIAYNFKDATLNLVRKGDSVYLAGNVHLFSPERKEPSKPTLIVLQRIVSQDTHDSSFMTATLKPAQKHQQNTPPAASIIKVFPNPFTSYVNVSFKVIRPSKVSVELYTITGVRVYAKSPENLSIGSYKIRIEPEDHIGAQTYILRLVFDNGNQDIKILKR